MSARRLASALLLLKQSAPVSAQLHSVADGSQIPSCARSLLQSSNSWAQLIFDTGSSLRSAHNAAQVLLEPQASANSQEAQQSSPRLVPARPAQAIAGHSIVQSDELDEESLSPTNKRQYRLKPALLSTLRHLSRTGSCADLVQLFEQDICLRQTFACNVVLTHLPPELVPEMYSFFVDKMGIKPNHNTVALRIRALGRIQRYVEAEQLFWQWQDDGNPIEPVMIGAMCGVYGLAGRPQAIEELLERAKAAGLPPIMSAYTSLIKAWAKQGSTVEVRRSMAHMVEDGVQPNALHYSAAITAHTRCGRPQEAEVLLSEMRQAGISPDAATYGRMISAFADARQPKKAAAIMQQVIDEGAVPSGHMWTSLACAWSKIGDAGEVRAVMADMRNAGLVPDAYLWNSLIHAHAMSFQPGRAAEALREMADSGVEPGVVAYTTLLNAYGAAADMSAAYQVLQDMQAAGLQPNSVTYTSLMCYHSQLGDVTKVQALHDEMTAKGIPLDVVSHLCTIEAAMESWGRAGRPAAALAQADQLFCQSPVLEMQPIFRSQDGRPWKRTFIDLHGYGHWSSQLALLSGLRSLYHDFLTPGWVWPASDLVVVTGKGSNSALRFQGPVRDVVLQFLQKLAPVKLGKQNDGLVAVKRNDMLKMFVTLKRQQSHFDAASFRDCFVLRSEKSRRV